MTRPSRTLATIGLLAAFCAAGAANAAQDQPQSVQQAKPDADTPPPPPKPAIPSDPALAVATVKLEGGYRASKVVGAAVYNSQNQQIGMIDDLIMDHDNKATLAVISVGGFLGVGGKMVALPYGKIMRADDGKIILQDGSKESLSRLPSFSYTP